MAVALRQNVGMILLAIYLILSGFAGIATLPIPGVLMAILAMLAGIFILVGR